MIKTIYRICFHRKRTFNRGLKLFLSAKEIEKLRDFEEECVHEYLLAKEDKEKSTVEERMSSTSDRYVYLIDIVNSMENICHFRVSHMSTRVETLQRNSTQQGNYFQNFDERLQRLEDMQASTIQLLNVLLQNMQTPLNNQRTLNESQSSRTSADRKVNEDELLNFTAISTPDEVTVPLNALLSSTASRTMRSGSFSNRKNTNPLPIPTSAAPQIVVGSFPEYLSMKSTAVTLITTDERLPIGTAGLGGSSSSLNVPDDGSYANLYEAEEAEHHIFGKLIKERFRKLSEVVEDIERTLPSHQQRHEDHQEIDQNTDDDEVLSTMDWVDTNGRTTYNSTHVSRFDISRDEHGDVFLSTSKRFFHSNKENKSSIVCFPDVQHIRETEQNTIPDVLIHPPIDDDDGDEKDN